MADDYTDDSSTSGTLFPGGQATGVLETYQDSDWFKIALTAGQYYVFESSISTTNTGTYQRLSLYNSQGTYFGSAYDSGTVKFSVKAPVTGDFYVVVEDQLYSTNYVPLAYTLKASMGVTDEIGDTRATAQALAVGEKYSSALEGGTDIDYFKISVQAGVTYLVTPSWKSGSPTGQLRVEDMDGYAVDPGSWYGTSSFTASTTGDHYIAVSSYWSNSAAVNYDITVSKPIDDYAASQAGAGQLTVGAPATNAALEVRNDRDWFSVDLNAGTLYWFTLGTGTSYPAYSGYGTLKLMSEDGTVVATLSGSSYASSFSPSVFEYTSTVAGKYYLEVSNSLSIAASYTVRAVVGETDDHGNTRETATVIGTGSGIAGKLAIPQDSDLFKLAVTAGKSYLVTLNGQDQASDNNLSLYGSASYYPGDNLLSYTKDGVGKYAVLTATATGDYYFTVSHGYQYGPSTYALLVTEAPADDYASDAKTKGVLAMNGHVSGILDYMGDADAFKVTLQYGAKYAFQLRGAGSGEGTLPLNQVSLQISGPTPNSYYYLNSNQDGTYTFTSVTGGDYTISVLPQNYYSGNPAEPIGSYTLHATALNGDVTGPTLVSYTPATNAAPYDNITLRFSEAIMRGVNSWNETITLRDSLGVVLESYYYYNDNRITIQGDTLTINPGGQLKPGNQYVLSVSSGFLTDLAGNKLAGNEILQIDTTDTMTTGGAGNDYLLGLGTGAILSGGDGIDTAMYNYDRGSYAVVRGAHSTTVARNSWDNTSSASDVLDGIERLMFSDITVALDIDGISGQAYRMYRAAFDRAPDLGGVGFWINAMDKGLSLHQVAQNFLSSAEFATMYGTAPNDSQFVNDLYKNVLDRAPDEGGLKFWLDVLANGAHRADVLMGFSESNENASAVLQVIGNGFDYIPYG